MIKQSSIDTVRSRVDMETIMRLYTTVNSSKMACCPIHNEKTPSLKIYEKTQRFKCFGCGESGDAFSLVMKMEKKTFYEAIEFLAQQTNTTLEYDEQSKAELQETKDLRTEMYTTTNEALGKYRKALSDLPDDSDATQYLRSRGYTNEKTDLWQIGFAPQDFKFITTPFINAGKHKSAEACGLINVKDGKTNDFFINRIIIPIHDHNGILVGLAGRTIPTGDPVTDKKFAKWLNPKESLIYSKKKVWYGLWQAQAAIKAEGFVYVVEGYMDVQSMHDGGMENTVASSGTEIDIDQARFLKRYTDHVVIAYDGDEPGINKAMKNIDTFLKLDFKVSIVEFPEGMDPDEFIRKYQDACVVNKQHEIEV